MLLLTASPDRGKISVKTLEWIIAFMKKCQKEYYKSDSVQ